MGLEILFLLLPIAALSGWLVGVRGSRGRARNRRGELSSDLFEGLNYVLNEQPDKAIEVFIHMAEVDSETVETHFALANLFFRRGEVDRAIRIHQNLIARPTLSRSQRRQALFDLGRDYMRAGLLDRAETLFQELTSDNEIGHHALRQLLTIYEQEKEWEKAIETAQRLTSFGRSGLNLVVAQYYCELAGAALECGDDVQAMKMVRWALAEDRSCVRASLLEAQLHLHQGNHKSAMKSLKRVEEQDPAFLPEIIAPLAESYRMLGRPLEMINYLRGILKTHNSISIILAQAELLQQQQGDHDAAAFILGHLRKRPSVRGMARLIDLKIGQTADSGARDDLLVLKDLTEKLLQDKPVYKCSHCGFTGKALHWQCPGCKQWNTVKPIHGIEGE